MQMISFLSSRSRMQTITYRCNRTSQPSLTHSEEFHLTLNASKCKYFLRSRKRQPLFPHQEIFISSSQIERVQSYCYLGVIVNQRISWSEHIQHLCLKVRKLIGMMYRQFYTWADTLTLRTVYLKLNSTAFRVFCSAMRSMQQEL